jgi:photosystem II stability/assembly factor-like uncharacterized protein
MTDRIDQDVVYALAAASDRLCFAARHSGLYRSDDGGAQWQLIADLPAGLPVTALAIADDGTIFAGVPGGIFHSSDSGQHWTVSALPAPPPFVSALAVSPNYQADGMVFAATLEDGVFRSTDRGAAWQAWNFGLVDLNVLSIAVSPAFVQDRTVYAGTDTVLFYSKNGGCAWRETGFPTDFAPVLALAARDDTLFAGTEASGLFRSVDRGQSWQRLLDSAAINALLLAPASSDILVVSNDSLWLSRDDGNSWSSRNPDANFDANFTSLAAPGGFTSELALLLGLSDGEVVSI